MTYPPICIPAGTLKVETSKLETSNNENENFELQNIMFSIETLENTIKLMELKHDELSTIKKIESGKFLLNAKALIKSIGKRWEFEVHNLIPKKSDGKPIVSQTCRCERMKVASINNVEFYSSIGWSKLVLMSSRLKIEKTDAVELFLFNYDIDIKTIQNMSTDEFEVYLKVKEAESKLKQKHLNISKEKVEQAIKMGITFDDKLLKKLCKENSPSQALNRMINFGICSSKESKNNNRTKNQGKLEELLEEIRAYGEAFGNGLVNETPEAYMLEDAAHYIGLIYHTLYKNNKHATIEGETYETLPVVN